MFFDNYIWPVELMSKKKNEKLTKSRAIVKTAIRTYEIDYIKFYCKKGCYNFITTELYGIAFSVKLVVDIEFFDSDSSEQINYDLEEISIL